MVGKTIQIYTVISLQYFRCTLIAGAFRDRSTNALRVVCLQAGGQGPTQNRRQYGASTVTPRQLPMSDRQPMTEDARSVISASASTRRHVLGALTYMHVQDQDTGVTRLVTSPCSYTLKEHERVALEPRSMVVVPSAHYCVVESPVQQADGLVVFDEVGQARLRHGEREVRLHQRPFPLYPGETLVCGVQPLPVVGVNQALRLRALQDTTDSKGTERTAGEEWFFGPGTYIPSPEVTVVDHVDAVIVGSNQVLRLRASQETTDCDGGRRRAGEEWLVTNEGAYIPWIGEEVVKVVEHTTLGSRQYCVVCTHVMGDKPRRKILKGPRSFFLHPGETLEDGIRDIHFLEANEAVDLVAREAFTDETVTPAVSRSVGDRWTVRGPAAVTPPAEAEVLREHSVIPLGPSEGVYVQNIRTGEVRVEMEKPYLLTAEELLWSKELSPDAERLLAEYRRETGTGAAERDKTRVVTYRVSDNQSAVVLNHITGESREAEGPVLVWLLPDEQFGVFSLPGGTPVVPNRSQSLTLPWWYPDEDYGEFHQLTDLVTVTTEPGKRVAYTVSANWRLKSTPFEFEKNGVYVAFCVLKDDLFADARCGDVKSDYSIGAFQFFGVTLSETPVDKA